MENFTAIYSTESIKDINYSFQAEDMASAINYCKTKFNFVVKIVCERKIVETVFRTKGTVKNVLGFETWKVDKSIFESKDFYDFYKNNLPLKPSENIYEAIKKAYSENGSITYNCGNGNQTFYFNEK